MDSEAKMTTYGIWICLSLLEQRRSHKRVRCNVLIWTIWKDPCGETKRPPDSHMQETPSNQRQWRQWEQEIHWKRMVRTWQSRSCPIIVAAETMTLNRSCQRVGSKQVVCRQQHPLLPLLPPHHHPFRRGRSYGD